MLWTVFVIIVFFWLPGLVSGHTLGGFIHILLVMGIIVLGFDLFREERYWRDLDPSRRS
ncbi:MAG: lmo0937 family membrane protein [Thermodesulfobacteriota bacterium]|nr:MAG: lmo0937 family membrane protein [Thermodesulfobacteriota bacterium]